MLIQTFENERDWLEARRGKITGSRLKKLVVKRGTEKKIEFYEMIAERLSKPLEVGEVKLSPLEHGHAYEAEAISRFEQMTGKEVDCTKCIWSREDNPNIAISPDGVVIGTDNTEAVEAKCLSEANHLKAYLTKEIPEEYEEQKLQYFIVNDKLQKLTFCFLNPRLMAADFFTIEFTRADVLAEIEEKLIFERQTLAEIDSIVDSLMSF
jgi:predicted phage-related endonuclease